LLIKNKQSPSPSKSKTTTETRSLVKSISNQELLNKIFDEFDTLLQEAVSDDHYSSKFETIKEKLRQLFNNLQKQNHALQEQIFALESCVPSLEQFENDDNVIKMGNIATQLKNKLVRFIKPNLSYRAARDEYLALLQSHERYQQLNNYIKQHESDLSVSNLARLIKTLLTIRVSKGHNEHQYLNQKLIWYLIIMYHNVMNIQKKQQIHPGRSSTVVNDRIRIS
jgi:hypothetical protein